MKSRWPYITLLLISLPGLFALYMFILLATDAGNNYGFWGLRTLLFTVPLLTAFSIWGLYTKRSFASLPVVWKILSIGVAIISATGATVVVVAFFTLASQI